MKQNIIRNYTIVLLAAAAILAAGRIARSFISNNRIPPKRLLEPLITVQPGNALVEVGTDATFSVTPAGGRAYQWMHNGTAIDGQTNSDLTIVNIQSKDAGFYFCNVHAGKELVKSLVATLLAYVIVDQDPIVVVYAQPIVSSGGSGTCPGKYKGYVNYAPTNGWGWVPSTNTTVYTATDTNRSNTKIEYVGAYGDNGCAQTSVTVPYPASSPEYGFSIIFTNDVPTNSYPILLNGFNL